MGNVKHTPGPWTAGDIATESVFDQRGNCIVDCYEDDIPPGEGAANARLIAAAPEMLEALKGLYETGAPEGLALTADELQLRFEAARAAISKATGGGQ